MSPRARLYTLCLLPVLYVAVAAVRATGGAAGALLGLLALPLALLAAFRLTEPRTIGEDLVGEAPRAAMRVAAAGGALYAAARSAGVGRAAFDAAAAVGVGAASTAALYALARVPEGRGLLEPELSTRRLDAALSALLVASVAATVPAAAALSVRRGGAIDPLTIDYALVAEGFGALLLLALASLRFRVARRLELGVVDRGAAALVLSATALAVAAPAAALGFAAPDRILPAAAIGSSLAVGITLVIPDPTLVGRTLRTLLVVCVLGTPIALFTAGVAATAPRQAGATVLIASIVLVLVGVISHRIAGRMLPEPARWLNALTRAQQAATIPEPYTALRGTLSQLRDNLGPSASSAVLYRLETRDQLSVDRAGYLHEALGTAPPEVFGFCDAEPEHTFRIEIARALEIRRPEVRPTLAWMEAHGFESVTSLRDDEGPVGLLAMPRAGRRTPLTLDEVLALGRLTERVASILSLSAALASARERQLSAEAEAKAAREAALDASRLLDRQGERYAAHARRVAHAAPLGRYSPAARLAQQELAQAARADGPIVLLTPPGVAADAFAAAAHLESARSEHPFVVASGADAREHRLSHWLDELTSPWSLARRGSLVVLDLPALPHDIQRLLASHIAGRLTAEGAPPSSPSPAPPLPAGDVYLIVSVRETIDALVARGRLIEELADALGDRAIPLPPLAARPEDMRAIALEYLNRIGLSLRGAPVGLTDDALAQLLEHAWPGNDQELDLVLLRAVQVAAGQAITGADLRRSGFEPTPPRAAGAPAPRSALESAAAASRSTRRRRS
jgi:hypothetical protein